MKVKTFQGETMSEALQRVKREFGRDAVILSTRTLTKGGFLGRGGRNTVEITAAPDTSSIPPSVVPAAASPPPRRTATPTTSRSSDGAGNTPQIDRLVAEMGGLKQIIQGLVRETQSSKASELPATLYQTYQELVSATVAEELALEIVGKVRRKLSEQQLPDGQAVRRELLAILLEKLPVAGPIKLRHADKPTIVALVGPTGAGKTTTIAKLAANATLLAKKTVGLITIDTYRIAAVDQLRTYAQIMNLPLEVVTVPEELPDAVARLSDRQLILIDTAGRSQKDSAKIEELRQFFAQCRPDEIHIVVPATAHPKTLSEVIDRFKSIGGNRLLFTKLDESVGLGILLNCLAKAGTKLSYITNGQDVPSDISVGHSAQVASMILGQTAPDLGREKPTSLITFGGRKAATKGVT